VVVKPSAREWRGEGRQAPPTKAEVKVDAKAVERWARDRGYLG
jgi:hypothetical protein